MNPVKSIGQVVSVRGAFADDDLDGQPTLLAGADAGGVVLGARAPIVLMSRVDGEHGRLASRAVAVLIVRRRAKTSQVAIPGAAP